VPRQDLHRNSRPQRRDGVPRPAIQDEAAGRAQTHFACGRNGVGGSGRPRAGGLTGTGLGAAGRLGPFGPAGGHGLSRVTLHLQGRSPDPTRPPHPGPRTPPLHLLEQHPRLQLRDHGAVRLRAEILATLRGDGEVELSAAARPHRRRPDPPLQRRFPPLAVRRPEPELGAAGDRGQQRAVRGRAEVRDSGADARRLAARRTRAQERQEQHDDTVTHRKNQRSEAGSTGQSSRTARGMSIRSVACAMFWSCLAFERNADFRSPIAGKISMTFRTFTIAALAAAGLVMADARQAAAQRIPSHYRFVDETQSLGAFVSHIWTDRGIVDLGPNPGIAFGARYSIRISGPFVAEGEALVFPTSRWMMRLQEVGSDTITTKVGETDLTLLGLSGGLRFDLTGPRTYRNLLPYLMASAGAAIRLS